MGRIFTKEDVREILFNISNRAGFDCSFVPIRISTRMKSTYGAFVFRIKDGVLEPIEFKFQDKLLSGDFPEEVVVSTIEHEYIHFLTNIANNFDHGHDDVFKTNCRRLGVNESTYFTGYHNAEVKDGFKLICTSCGKEVARRRQEVSAKRIQKKFLSGCCNKKIKIIKDVF